MTVGDKTCYEHILRINLTFAQSCDEVILLGVVIDKSLDFKKQIDDLRSIRKFINVEKAKKLGNDFIDSQFNYAALVWMFCRKTFYSKIEKNAPYDFKL